MRRFVVLSVILGGRHVIYNCGHFRRVTNGLHDDLGRIRRRTSGWRVIRRTAVFAGTVNIGHWRSAAISLFLCAPPAQSSLLRRPATVGWPSAGLVRTKTFISPFSEHMEIERRHRHTLQLALFPDQPALGNFQNAKVANGLCCVQLQAGYSKQALNNF